ncbi:hypothetical protein MPTK1_4g09950 [Marchantia polymorpha subsp. ruderalis]|uniref:Iron-binding zinc finger CDGSH type domain-containing protein n=2 Tax=Marchantia polymorpha TaxID=3197 RepID=A0A176W4I9_MARPO|nr:hypothetical protein AXG93_3309s1410 [Marchantia polymorpha subsp. ruderalis]PTQ29966.1 hypothetical protein MARPO_0132s0038 [Marchantia polymorpha]BBN08236.1 hypothetical protein Mp_4g09950 [Marchantia polymorpha subsp. ruderalis]|eukprot:PTQ29966.1 hypothetical protein MARPO_0132s0038 [Marchantia polymorpha]
MASIATQAFSSLAAAATSLRGVVVPQQQQQQMLRAGAGRSFRLVQVRAESAEATASVAINPSIKKESDKVVDTVVVGELAKPLTAYCRCWRSGTFPLCDGSHVKHNKATGDNVGPLLLKK